MTDPKDPTHSHEPSKEIDLDEDLHFINVPETPEKDLLMEEWKAKGYKDIAVPDESTSTNVTTSSNITQKADIPTTVSFPAKKSWLSRLFSRSEEPKKSDSALSAEQSPITNINKKPPLADQWEKFAETTNAYAKLQKTLEPESKGNTPPTAGFKNASVTKAAIPPPETSPVATSAEPTLKPGSETPKQNPLPQK